VYSSKTEIFKEFNEDIFLRKPSKNTNSLQQHRTSSAPFLATHCLKKTTKSTASINCKVLAITASVFDYSDY
jgi:hypothetical protein